MMVGVERTDISELMDAKTDQDGFLHAKIALAKPGIYPYILDDGTIRRELKPPEELLSEATVASINYKPVTDMHPSELVTAERWWATCGWTHNDAQVENDKIIVGESIFYGDLIQDVLSGAKAQVSGGFRCDIDMTSGVWEGQEYDAVQRNIRFNHVAHVPQGRCGPECAIILDADDARGYRNDSQDARVPRIERRHPPSALPNDTRGDKTMATVKVKIGEQEFEVAKEVADQLQTLETDKAQLETDKAALETEKQDLVKERDQLKGAADAKEDAVNALQAKVTDLESKVESLPSANVDEVVSKRLELIDTVRQFCGDSAEIAGKTEQDLKVMVIQQLSKDFNADSHTGDYIQARFDAAVEMLGKLNSRESNGFSQLRSPKTDGGVNTKLDELKAARLRIGQRKEGD